MRRKELVMVYEVRSDGNVLASFSEESKAKREMRRLRKEGLKVKVYTRWVEPVKPEKVKRKKKEIKPVSKCTPDTKVNDWLIWKGLKPVGKDMTFQQLYSAIVIDQRLPEEVLGDCNGRKSELIKGIVQAMDHPAVTERYIQSVIKGIEKQRKVSRPSELWLRPMDWEVSPLAADELARYWRTLNEPYFLGAYRSGRPCDPDLRDSDLSVQPTDDGLVLCYRDIPDRKVYIVLKDIDWVGINDRYLELFGKDREGKGQMVALLLSSPKRSIVEKDLRDGWYLLDSSVLLCLITSDRRLREDDVGVYECYLDYMYVYPTFGGKYGRKTGRIGLNKGMEMNEFIQAHFSARSIEYLPMGDPFRLVDAFANDDKGYLDRFFRQYPQARVSA